MVESTKTDKQSAAQVIQQQEDEALEYFMRSASIDFNKPYIDDTENKTTSFFKMNGVEYTCSKRETSAGNNILFITGDLIENRHNSAVFDARTKKLKGSLFFTGRQLFDMLNFLKANHAKLFD